MVYVLKIGYLSFAFPTSRGLQTVMDTLGKARELKRGFMPGLDKPEEMELEDEPVAVSMHCVQGVSFASGKKARREVIEPEVMPRKCEYTDERDFTAEQARRLGESDAVVAMRLAGRTPARIGAGSSRAVAGQLRLMLEERNAK